MGEHHVAAVATTLQPRVSHIALHQVNGARIGVDLRACPSPFGRFEATNIEFQPRKRELKPRTDQKSLSTSTRGNCFCFRGHDAFKGH